MQERDNSGSGVSQPPALNPTIEPSGPLYISHSKLNTWNRCQQQYHWSYNENWQPKQRREYLQTGTEVHKLLEKYYNEGELNIPEIIMDRSKYLDFDDLKSFQLAVMVAKRYQEDFAPIADAYWEVLETEYHFEIPMVTHSGVEFVLEGYVDIIARDTRHDKIWVWDHKTGTRAPSEQQVLMDAQTPTYAAAIKKHMGVDVHGLMFNYINTYDYKNHLTVPTEKLFKRIITYRTPREMENFLEVLYRQVDDLARRRFEPPIKNLSRDCQSCFFYNPCLMDMKGVDPSDIFSIEYEKKKPRKEVASGRVELPIL